jgi:hypothetical protein
MRLPAYYIIPLFICLCSLTGCSDTSTLVETKDPYAERWNEILADRKMCKDSDYKDEEALNRAEAAALKLQSDSPEYKGLIGDEETSIEGLIVLIALDKTTLASKKTIREFEFQQRMLDLKQKYGN